MFTSEIVLIRFLQWFLLLSIATIIWNVPTLLIAWTFSWEVFSFLPPLGAVFGIVWALIHLAVVFILGAGLLAPDIYYSGCNRWTKNSKKFKHPITIQG